MRAAYLSAAGVREHQSKYKLTAVLFALLK
jgi:hypothetical protein